MKSVVFFSRTGCLLPLLIFLNLFLGWIVFKPLPWLFIEAVLILIFMINSFILARKIASSFSKRNNVIDAEGEVIEDKAQPGHLDKKGLTNK